MQYSHNDHYRWGWNDGWFNDPIPGGDFKVQIGSCTTKPLSFRFECVRAVHLITKQFTKPTLIGLSGGSDSQVACLAFMEAGVPFTPLILKLLDGKGEHANPQDTKMAFAFCEKHGLTPMVEEVDVNAWYLGRGEELAKEHCLGGVETLLQLSAIEKFKDQYSYIMAGGDVSITKRYDGADDPLITLFSPTPIQQHLLKYNIEGVTKFFMYTPELIASYLDNDIMQAFYGANPTIYDTYTTAKGVQPGTWWWCFNLFIKPLFYVQQWPELLQQRKYTGFEGLTDRLVQSRKRFEELHAAYDMPRRKIIVRIDELVDHLRSRNGPKVWVNNGTPEFSLIKADVS